MPTYQYACTECGHAFEQFQSFSDDSLTVCPQCAGRLRKVFNAVGVVFKGSGFYRTDSRAAASAGVGGEPAKHDKHDKPKSDAATVPTATKSDAAKTTATSTTKSDSTTAA